MTIRTRGGLVVTTSSSTIYTIYTALFRNVQQLHFVHVTVYSTGYDADSPIRPTSTCPDKSCCPGEGWSKLTLPVELPSHNNARLKANPCLDSSTPGTPPVKAL
jgi:hypothetical protein